MGTVKVIQVVETASVKTLGHVKQLYSSKNWLKKKKERPWGRSDHKGARVPGAQWTMGRKGGENIRKVNGAGWRQACGYCMEFGFYIEWDMILKDFEQKSDM